MTKFLDSEKYKEWLSLSEENRRQSFSLIDSAWQDNSRREVLIEKGVKIYYDKNIYSAKEFTDQPIFASRNKAEAEPARALTVFETIRQCRMAFLGKSLVENGLSQSLSELGLTSDTMIATAAREWAKTKIIDGWVMDSEKEELLFFRPIQCLNIKPDM